MSIVFINKTCKRIIPSIKVSNTSIFNIYCREFSDKNVISKKKKGAGDKKASVDIFTKFIQTAEASKRVKLDFTDEEFAQHAIIAKEYQRQCTIRHNRRESDLSTKIWLQQEAIRSLPDELRLKAEEIDDTPPPKDRPWASFATPPIKGFDARKYTGRDTSENDEPVVIF